MIQVLTVLVALVCLLLMGVILIQNPKGGGLDSTFGGGGASNALGAAKSADVVEKLTWGLAITLFILCIITSLVVQGGGSGNMRDSKTQGSHVMPIQNNDVSTATTYYYKG